MVVPNLLRLEFTIVSQLGLNQDLPPDVFSAYLNIPIFCSGIRSGPLLPSSRWVYSIVSLVGATSGPCTLESNMLRVDDDILMAIPELYRYGREGKWFGTRLFLVYIFDGVVQVSIHLSFLSSALSNVFN